MIDFRYHLVSIVAVFLALAIGIVVGATQLQSATVSTLDNQSKTETQQIGSLRAQNRSLQNQLGSAEQFAQASAPSLLSGRLSGQRVVLVTAPGAASAIATGVTSTLEQAGAKVTGQVALQQAFFGASAQNETSLGQLARSLEPPGFDPAGPPAQLASQTKIAAQQQAAQVIAAALVTQSVSTQVTGTLDSSGLSATEANQILTGFAHQGFLQVSPPSGTTTLQPATLAVVVIPSSPPQAGDTDLANLALISVAYQLRALSRGVVVAGPLSGSGAGSAIDELINGNTGVEVSSVDNADTELGQVMVAQACSSLLAGQKPAAYGVGTNVVPTPGPDPTATPAATKSPAPKRSGGG
jgi:Copper transport outer membrane protein, MctB